MGRYRRKLENFMNDFNVRKKLFIIYVFCVIIPLVLTDSIILYILLDAEKKEQLYEFENLANAVRYNLEYTFEEVVKEMNDIIKQGALWNGRDCFDA